MDGDKRNWAEININGLENELKSIDRKKYLILQWSHRLSPAIVSLADLFQQAQKLKRCLDCMAIILDYVVLLGSSQTVTQMGGDNGRI